MNLNVIYHQLQIIIEQKIISCLVEIVVNIHKKYWTFLIQIMPVKLRLGMKIIFMRQNPYFFHSGPDEFWTKIRIGIGHRITSSNMSDQKSGPVIHGSEVHSRKRLFYKDKISMPKWKVIWLISLVVVLVATPQIISWEGNREHKARPIKTPVGMTANGIHHGQLLAIRPVSYQSIWSLPLK